MQQTLPAIVDAAIETIKIHEEMMTRLDQAIGDGDHGTNMARGFAEIEKQKASYSGMPLGDALKKMGMALVSKVGGASGPLYGSLLMDMGKAAPELAAGEMPDLDQAAQMFEAGIEAVKRRGKSDEGCKTMLDVLCPAARALRSSIDGGLQNEAGSRLIAAAAHGLHETARMKATRGRASFLGERSIDHLDPGAYSSAMLISAIVGVIDRPGAS